MKDGDDDVKKHFTLAVHSTSGNTFEEPETSCAVRETEPPERIPTGKLQRPVFNALKSEYLRYGPILAPEALDLAKTALDDQPKNRRSTRAKETLASLKCAGYIKEDKDQCIYFP